jgi:hypothetical protein
MRRWLLGGAAPRFAFAALGQGYGTGSSYTLSAQPLGKPHATRRIFAVICAYRGANANIGLSSVTIGGVAATIHTNPGYADGSFSLSIGIASAVVPAGETGDVSVVHNGVAGDVRVYLYRMVKGAAAPAAVDSASVGGGSSGVSTTLDPPAGGIALMGVQNGHGSSVLPISWTNLTGDFANGTANVGAAAHAAYPGADPGSTVYTFTASNGMQRVLAAAIAWGPA